MRSVTALIFLLACLCSKNSFAQNLVSNNSFEDHPACPANLLSIPYSAGYTYFPYVLNWTNPVKQSSPDYLHTCATPGSGVKIPDATFGYQQPFTGNAYGGIIAFEGKFVNGNLTFDYREYLQNKLAQPLIAGRKYCVSFFVSPTISAGLNFNFINIDEVGANFSAQRPVDTQNYTISLSYQIRNKPGNYLSDTSKWYEISGNFTATGGEEWITIGCFKNTNTYPPFQQVYPPVADPALTHRSYLYIDEVSVREITTADTVTNVHDTVVCKLSGLSLPLSGAQGALSYTWNNGAQNSQQTVTDTGTYWCQSVFNCGMVTDSFRIEYQHQNILNLGNEIINCFSQPVTIIPNFNYNTYQWSTGATGNSITVNQSGSYILTVSDICGMQQDTVEVTIQPPTPAPVVRDTVICQLSNSPALEVTGSSLLWYHTLNAVTGYPVQPYISTINYGNQILYVTQTIGKCESQKVPIHIKVKYKPDPDIGDYMLICKNVDTLIGQQYPEVFYLWNTGETVCCIKPGETGTYRLTLSNNCGMASDTTFVELSPCDECIAMPNAFTPNNDGRNDAFTPVIICPVASFRMELFDRWGEMVFTTNDPAKGWNGRYNDALAATGVYVCIIEYRSSVTGSRKFLKGNLTLIQ